MKVLSSNPETIAEPAFIPESTMSSPPAQDATDFSQLMNTEIKASMPKALKDNIVDIESSSVIEKLDMDSSSVKNSDTEELDSVINFDLNPLLGQIALIQQGKTNEVPQPTVDTTSDAFTPTDIESKKNQIVMNEKGIQKDIAKSLNLGVSIELPVINNQDDGLKDAGYQPTKQDIEIDKKPVLLMNEMKSEVSNTLPTISTVMTTNADSAGVDAQVISTTVIKPKKDIQDVIPNKFTGALTQLGEFINSHTNRQLAPQVADTYSAPVASIVNKEVNEVATKIQFLPATMDNLLKETYSANIKIHPAELGEVTAKLKIDKNSAELIILTENAFVKGIVEANLPQLRENFQHADITLTQVDVMTTDSGSKDQSNSQSRTYEKAIPVEASQEMVINQTISPKVVTSTQNSIIDTYA